MSVEAYPLYWPEGWQRSKYKEQSRFKTGFGSARNLLFAELGRMGASKIVLSTNIPLRNDGLPRANMRPDNGDSGVAVYFQRKGKPMAFACDKFSKPEDNIYAIAKTIDAMRGIELNIERLIGKTFGKVTNVNDEEIQFLSDDGNNYRLFHSQDCCERVSVEDICGDLHDLEGTPILSASEETSDTNPEGVTPEYQDSFTWTFYRFSTIKGTVVIRWYGESNGYYSESVDLGEF